MQASRPQPALLEGLSRFLVEHEPHGQGFDVAHPAGPSGRVSITCRGCGARHVYATATLEIERELTIEAVPASAAEAERTATRAEVTPIPGQGRPARPAKAPERKRPSRVVTAGLLALAVAAFAFAVIRLATDGNSSSRKTAQRTPPPPPANPEPSPRIPTGRAMRIRTPAFALQAPRGWVRDTSQGGLLIHPRGRDLPSLQVYFQHRPGLSLAAMAGQTRTFLRSRGAKDVSPVRRLAVRGDPAFRITARTEGRIMTATGIRHGPTRYLLLVSRSEKGPATRELGAAYASFRPR